MYRTVLLRALTSIILLLPAARATTIPRLSFEQLTDASEVIASGEVTQSWAAWDSEHKYIWTHYRLNVTDIVRGSRVSSVEFAEPGGALGTVSMMIPGTVTYGVGDRVVVFLARMPNGYLRTAGWAQGKYTLDASGRLHGQALMGTVGSMRSLDGMVFGEFTRRVIARIRATGGRLQ